MANETNWNWKINCSENRNGKVQVILKTSCPWRPKESKLVLYRSSQLPNNPDNNIVWSKWWAPNDNANGRDEIVYKYESDQNWGTSTANWSAALIAKDDNNAAGGNYFYVTKSTETSWSWVIGCGEIHGKVKIILKTSCPWRPKESKLILYKGAQPKDPNDRNVWKQWWAPENRNNMQVEYETNQDWGSDWSAALIAKNGNNAAAGDYCYVVKSEVTVRQTTNIR